MGAINRSIQARRWIRIGQNAVAQKPQGLGNKVMTLTEYKQKKIKLNLQAPKYRIICKSCNQPEFSCFCSCIKKFNPQINFVILIHPIEASRRIATGRMSNLCLENSYLIKGQDYTNNSLVNQLIADTDYESMILYPGQQSRNLTFMEQSEKIKVFNPNKKLRIFVIDGTWATAKKMVRQSLNLHSLPRICFSSKSESTFRVRKQPRPGCFSTIEAIHHTIELLGAQNGFDLESRKHDNLLTVFDSMVETQLRFIAEANLNLRTASYRRESQKKSA
jgi:DTW domain-containing protein YfiP